MVDLKNIYAMVSSRIDSVDFEGLWPGFRRFEFALYDDSQAILNGKPVERTDSFLGNTSIEYEGRHIAIWKMDEDTDLDVLASKLIHEMFHAYQHECGENRFPNELEALLSYEYSSDYLRLKYRETLLLADLCETFKPKKLKEFLNLRKTRMLLYPYQYRYECSIEVIEGTAQYVELLALKQLSSAKFENAKARCIRRLRDMSLLIPIRILCYDIGAMLLAMCRFNGLAFNSEIGNADSHLLPDAVFDGVSGDAVPEECREVDEFYADSVKGFRERIQRITCSNAPIAEGAFKLLGVNIYSARYLDGYIYTEYFLMYEDAQPITLYGNYLIKLVQGKVAAVYKD